MWMALLLMVAVAVMGTSTGVVVGMNVAPPLPPPAVVNAAAGGKAVQNGSPKCCEFYYQSKWDEFNKCVADSGVTPTCTQTTNTITNTQAQEECHYQGKQYAVGQTVEVHPAHCVRMECALLPQRKMDGEKTVNTKVTLKLVIVDDHPGCCMKGGRMVQHGYEEKVERVGGQEGLCGTLTCLHGTWVTGGNHYSCGTHLRACVSTWQKRYQHGEVVKVDTTSVNGGQCIRHTCLNGHIKKDKCCCVGEGAVVACEEEESVVDSCSHHVCRNGTLTTTHSPGCCVEKGRRFNDGEVVEKGGKSDPCYQWVCQEGSVVYMSSPRCCENPRGELVPPGHPLLLDLPKCLLVVCVEGAVTSDRSIKGQCGCCESGLYLFPNGKTHQADPCVNTTCTNTTWTKTISPECGECKLLRQGGEWPKVRTLSQVWSEVRSKCMKYTLIHDGSQAPTLPTIYVSIGRCTREQGFFSSYSDTYKARNFVELYGDDKESEESTVEPFGGESSIERPASRETNNNNNNTEGDDYDYHTNEPLGYENTPNNTYNDTYDYANNYDYYDYDGYRKRRQLSSHKDYTRTHNIHTRYPNNNNNNKNINHALKKRHHKHKHHHALSYDDFHSHNRKKRQSFDDDDDDDEDFLLDDETDQSLWCMNSITIHNPMINVTLLVSGRILVNNEEVTLPYSNNNWSNFVVGSFPNTLIVRVGKAMVWLTREQEMKIMGVVAPKDSNLRGLCVRGGGGTTTANTTTTTSTNSWGAGEMCYPGDRGDRQVRKAITEDQDDDDVFGVLNIATDSSCSEDRRQRYLQACDLLVSQRGLGENCTAVVTKYECVQELCANPESHDLHLYYDLLLRHMEECSLVGHQDNVRAVHHAEALALALLPIFSQYFERVSVTNETFKGIMSAVDHFITLLSPSLKKLCHAVRTASVRFLPDVIVLLMKTEAALSQSKAYLLSTLGRALSMALDRLEPSLLQFIYVTAPTCPRFVSTLYNVIKVMTGHLAPVVMPRVKDCIRRDSEIYQHVQSRLQELQEEMEAEESIFTEKEAFERNMSELTKSIQVLLSIDRNQSEKIGKDVYGLLMNVKRRLLDKGVPLKDLRCTLDPSGLYRLLLSRPFASETTVMTTTTTTTTLRAF